MVDANMTVKYHNAIGNICMQTEVKANVYSLAYAAPYCRGIVECSFSYLLKRYFLFIRAVLTPSRDAKGVEGEGNGEDCPSKSIITGSGERRKLAQQGPGRSPGRQRILGIFQRLRSFLVKGF